MVAGSNPAGPILLKRVLESSSVAMKEYDPIKSNAIKSDLKKPGPQKNNKQDQKLFNWHRFKTPSLMLVFFFLGFFIILGVFYQTAGNPASSLTLIFNRVSAKGLPAVVFNKEGPFTEKEAIQLYRKALALKKTGKTEEAVSHWKTLESVYPGLHDFILIHEAEGYKDMGNEWAVQKKLNALITDYPESPLMAYAYYLLGQSQVRANQDQDAQKSFATLSKAFPETDYAIARLYYQGVLALKKYAEAEKAAQIPLVAPGQQGPVKKSLPSQKINAAEKKKWRNQAIVHFGNYLDQCQYCTFSTDSARNLKRLLPAKSRSVEQNRKIALAISQAPEPDEIQGLINMLLPSSKHPAVWQKLAELQHSVSGNPQARQSAKLTTIQGLLAATQQDSAQAAIDQLLLYQESRTQKITLLTAIGSGKPPYETLKLGKDYALWKLAQYKPTQAKRYYQKIVAAYPQSQFAPESNWQLLRDLLRKKQHAQYIQKANVFLKQYAYARSAPKAQFWVAKLQEKQNKAAAIKTYTRIIQRFPISYYAYRAQGRLAGLQGKKDPGWATAVRKSHEHLNAAPDFNHVLETVALLPQCNTANPIAHMPLRDPHFCDRAATLQKLLAADDLKRLAASRGYENDPVIQSWFAHATGAHSKGIRIVRDALLAQEKKQLEPKAASSKKAMAKTAKNKFKQVTWPIEYSVGKQLLFPTLFKQPLGQFSEAVKIDAVLAQSLLREESYFNPLALSGSNAHGLMQLLPGTAAEVAGWEKLPSFKTSDLFNPTINIRLGTRYLSYLHQRFNQQSVFAVGAYNGGPGAMTRWMKASKDLPADPDRFVEFIPYEQSRHYIEKVFASYWNYQSLY
ncbi:MAG: transglycosylase SLT domain-containing protein [Cyanobacteria bacterium P01_H01_bin.74]